MRQPAGQEEYLEQIYRLSPNGRVQLSALARALDVKGPSVTEMCRTLSDKGLVTYEPRSGVCLTDEGRKQASQMIRRHRLAERLLTDFVGLPWELAHDEACKYEHVISDQVEHLLAAALPATCPHGNPIDGQPAEAEHLSEMAPGTRGEVVRIEREESQVLKYLAHLGLVPGATVEVVNRAPMNGPFLVSVGDASYAIGCDVAERVMVRRVANEE
ncbi:MAG: DtxR family transcriptional regulator [Bacillota bacterium]